MKRRGEKIRAGDVVACTGAEAHELMTAAKAMPRGAVLSQDCFTNYAAPVLKDGEIVDPACPFCGAPWMLDDARLNIKGKGALP